MQPMRCHPRVVAVAAMTMVLATAGPVYGHAALGSSEPEDGARLGAPPETVSVTYTEPPTTDARFAVIDGCERDITGEVAILNRTIDATVDGGEPGEWTVRWRVISAVDGHMTPDEISFRVRGRPDCSAAVDPAPDERRDAPAASVPLVPIGIASAVVLALALGIRLRSRSGTST